MEDQKFDKLYKLLCEKAEQQTKEIKSEIRSTFSNVETKIKSVIRRVETLESQCLQLERRSRKNNIVVFGFELKGRDIIEGIVEKLNELFDISLKQEDLNNAYKLGCSKVPPILVEFKTYFKKSLIFKDPSKLKKLKEANIALSNDMCNEDRQNHKILRTHFLEAKRSGKEARIKEDTLYIEGEPFTVHDLTDTENMDLETDDDETQADTEEDREQNDSEDPQPGGSKPQRQQKTGKKAERVVVAERKRKRKALTPSPSVQTRNTRRNKGRK